jgi:hypothetical protein
VTRAEDQLIEALQRLPEKPADTAPQAGKKRYSEQMSELIAAAFAGELRSRGLREARPSLPGEVGLTGAERRMAGGIGAKKVDVTWATEESGLLLALSVKCINFRDSRTRNYQKNVTNRRSDMLFEAVTLHRRFPYAVLGGFMFFDRGALEDGTKTRSSTFVNTHRRLRLFNGRRDPADREEQYERLYVALIDATSWARWVRFSIAGEPDTEVDLDVIFNELVSIVADRNPDFYEYFEGTLRRSRT